MLTYLMIFGGLLLVNISSLLAIKLIFKGEKGE